MQGRTKVLIVDDDLEILAQLRWALQGEFHLLLVADPAEAVEILRRGSLPAVALVDLHLPPDTSSIDGGISVIRTLRRASESMRIIAISASPSAEVDRASRSAGAATLLGKPVHVATLIKELKT